MDKVRFGVVGTNFITDWVLAGAAQDNRFELAAVCSRTEGRAEEFARKYNIPHRFTSLEEMAASPFVDAVYIATPNFLHASQSILCMSYGKHVLCEKPLASNAAEAKAMIEASGRYNVTLMEAMKPTLTPNFRSIMENIGKVGKIRRYFASYCQYSSRYDRFKAGEKMNAFNPEYSNGAVMDIGVYTAFNPEYSNGAVMDIGVYTIYPMVVLFGMPERIIASGTILSSDTDGQGSVLFQYPGMEATVLYSKIADSYLPTEIQGEDGTMLVDRINSIRKVTFIPRKQLVVAGKSGQVTPVDLTFATNKDEYCYEVSEFIDLVLAGRRESAINSHQNSMSVMLITDEIRRQLSVTFPADCGGTFPDLYRTPHWHAR